MSIHTSRRGEPTFKHNISTATDQNDADDNDEKDVDDNDNRILSVFVEVEQSIYWNVRNFTNICGDCFVDRICYLEF